jgi:glycerophosphoryl diester phosphodiesterase
MIAGPVDARDTTRANGQTNMRMSFTALVAAAAFCAAAALPMNATAAAQSEPKPPVAPPGQLEIVSHRGESYDAPENTLAAINLGWERGMSGVEMDLHLTKDGQLITIHDKDTFRTTGGKTQGGTKKVVLEQTADELRQLDVGRWKAPPFAGERMALIDEVLATLPKEKHRRLFIEVKVGPDAAAPLVAAIRKAGRPHEQTAVISFNLDTCAEVKKQMPELQVYYLHSMKADKQAGTPAPTIDELIQAARGAKLDGLDLSYKGPIDAAMVKKVKDAGLKFYVWTVDEPADAKRMVSYGVDGITTNRGLYLREQLGLIDAPTSPAASAK